LSQKQTEIFTFAFYYGCQWALEFHLFIASIQHNLSFRFAQETRFRLHCSQKKNLKKKTLPVQVQRAKLPLPHA
jgi:hypothetical protein